MMRRGPGRVHILEMGDDGSYGDNNGEDMSDGSIAPLELINRHSGEHLRLTRFADKDGVWLELKGTLPPRSEGPPLHIHLNEDEAGRVIAGVLSAVVGGRSITAAAGEDVHLPMGEPHRWWNAGDDELVFEGRAKPVVDLDRMLQALFEVVNAGPAGRPPLFYMAHVMHRHRRTQIALVVPAIVQKIMFPIVIGIGQLLGKYRGTDWPGCPARCQGAPTAPSDVRA
jgi:mannose-6-phosphate isomerase-like protein (cupin superfamily)